MVRYAFEPLVDLDSNDTVAKVGTCYWAKFSSRGKESFRLDTRIYLSPIAAPRPNDPCVGAVVGKNPGSARVRAGTKKRSTGDFEAIDLANDRLLPTVRSVVERAYSNARTQPPPGAYVQVLNLFYLCNPDLSAAVTAVGQVSNPPVCASEKRSFPWVWYMWGPQSRDLDYFKARFKTVEARTHFFFDQRTRVVCQRKPGVGDFARHLQGLGLSPVQHVLARLVA